MKHENLILFIIVVVLLVAPLAMYSGLGEDEGYFGGSDDQGSDGVSETGYEPWFNSFWEPPSGEIESLLFAVQAAIGAGIIGYIFGYWRGENKKKDEN
ncbi:energy-coupling factor ABC transporter substrate-binding protein [uncultured Methanobrevibacter sp.]|uniref:energy-coupling factor ABC transporter substrate-binding protein n=1 Tax=uncultured Methanobrevibacter sp. TaxID=253161 RepID=UPI00261A5CBE